MISINIRNSNEQDISNDDSPCLADRELLWKRDRHKWYDRSIFKVRELSEEEKAIFSEVVSPYVEPKLKAEKVSSQVVAGTNYCFVCKDPDGKRVEVVVYVPLPGNGDPEIISVNEEELMDDFPSNSQIFITPSARTL